ncbi:hypothetical protein IE53DRAFT_366908 [Violaceomyces palustris]|uniref:Uncharacterized protein n=1 Tax=Violaceomyces palustris TaxID=1673888 RepID=A0ACD0P3W0_9BASI|nr:hypothetical protein IE53DRAFT_366908 [Violaceomyces palustris]
MASWVEHAHILANNSPMGMLGGVTSLSFDPYSELIWAGTSVGQVASHFGSELQRYSSYPAHGTTTRPGAVKSLLVDERHVYSVGDGGIKCSNRRGIARWTMLTSEQAPSLSLSSMCASPIAASSDIVAGGASQSASTTGELSADDDVVLVVNNATGSVIRKVSSEAPLLQLRKSARLICAGTVNGHIQLRDPRSLRVEQRLHAHPGGLVDMQADGNLVYSVGWTVRQGHPVPEPLVKVHDLRTMRPLVPIPFAAPGGPALLAIHPKLSTTVIVSAPQGQFQIVDVGNPGEGRFFQMNSASFVSSLAMSPSADFIAFGEADGSVRLWSSSSDTTSLRFNSFATSAPELPDVPEPPPYVSWTTETPLSSIGMPYYSESLLSVFEPEHYASEASPLFNLPSKIDPSVIANMRLNDFVGYANLPRHLRGRRNVISGRAPSRSHATLNRAEDRKRVGLPLFRSEKEKEAAKKAANRGNGAALDAEEDAEVPESPSGASLDSAPGYYRLKTIQYSRFGIEDFDFEFYNKTPYSGLETHIQNSYANSYLQALHYLSPFRALAKAHTLQNCPREYCLLCEAGFLFRMLEDAKGANCQATNFLRAFGNSQRATTLGLMDKDDSPSSDTAYSNLIQSFNRFMLDATSFESQPPSSGQARSKGSSSDPRQKRGSGNGNGNGRAGQSLDGEASSPTSSGEQANGVGKNDAKSVVSALFSVSSTTRTTCVHCGRETHRNSVSHVVDLVYPRKALSNEPPPPSDFASVLRSALVRETQSRAACRGCQFTALFRSRRVLPNNRDLPRALSINAAVHTGEQLSFWLDGKGPGGKGSGRTYLPPRVAVEVKGDDVRTRGIWEAKDLSGLEGSAIYKLRALIVQIQADKDVPHLCAIVRVPEAEAEAEIQVADTDAKEAETAGKGLKRASPWYLFNDFLVRNIGEEEALGFPNPWKIPAVMLWEREDVVEPPPQADKAPDTREEMDSSILCEDFNISRNRDPKRIRHEPLARDEIPKPGTLVSIDAEFVALNQEELEVRSDGTRSVIRPTRLSLARVSVLRGQGPKEGKPFIDDHIHTQEQVVDYLTKFSGILPGDLDPSTSRHTLVPLKVAYKKLRLLVDLGCVFIGHGLKKDFRIINIHVPPSQVIDTVDLYHSADHPRKLSLRFLSWFLLKQDIQGGGSGGNGGNGGGGEAEEGHDSIEDALAALRLFRLYQRFQEDQRINDVMEDLYDHGRRLNWKPPTALTSPPKRAF